LSPEWFIFAYPSVKNKSSKDETAKNRKPEIEPHHIDNTQN